MSELWIIFYADVLLELNLLFIFSSAINTGSGSAQSLGVEDLIDFQL